MEDRVTALLRLADNIEMEAMKVRWIAESIRRDCRCSNVVTINIDEEPKALPQKRYFLPRSLKLIGPGYQL